jgi:hypothetical protein
MKTILFLDITDLLPINEETDADHEVAYLQRQVDLPFPPEKDGWVWFTDNPGEGDIFDAAVINEPPDVYCPNGKRPFVAAFCRLAFKPEVTFDYVVHRLLTAGWRKVPDETVGPLAVSRAIRQAWYVERDKEE